MQSRTAAMAQRLTLAMHELDRAVAGLEDIGERRAADELADAYETIQRHRDALRTRAHQ